jgi:hypothetical protein
VFLVFVFNTNWILGALIQGMIVGTLMSFVGEFLNGTFDGKYSAAL